MSLAKKSRWPGNKYEGEWKNDQMHGQGTYYFSNGNRYTGQWQKDNMSGLGTMVYSNNDRYEGEWQNGDRHGKGSYYYYITGGVEKGRWKYDEFEGD